MKIYTKTGDTGTTALFGGKRISKSDLRIDTYGTVDELNSHIGMVRDLLHHACRRAELKEIQDILFTIGATLASDPDKPKAAKIPDVVDNDLVYLEKAIDEMDAELNPLKAFILPGGHASVSACHIARCVCRRTERLTVALNEVSEVESTAIQYLNRLSDYLFTLCRWMTKDLGVEEVEWHPRNA